VTRAADGAPLSGLTVGLRDLGLSAVTDRNGRYALFRVPEGGHTVLARWPGYRPAESDVSVTAGDTVTADFALESKPVLLGDIVVTGAARTPQRVVEAPTAVSVLDSSRADEVALTGQVPRALASLPGVDVMQNGVFDFNVSARGFNADLSRRTLVLQDGRDQAFSFLGAPLWAALDGPVAGRLEVVRGPGSALYGPNAYAGVVNYVTRSPREAVGTRLTAAGGGLNTFRADLSHAGVFGTGRFGYRLTGGYYRSDNWNRSRTRFDGTALGREYGSATEDSVPHITEIVPLHGQRVDPITGAALGDPDPTIGARGSARLDWYRDDGSVMTAEGGNDYLLGEVFVATQRYQSRGINRPWGRVEWAAPRFDLMAWWSGEWFERPIPGLLTGQQIRNSSQTLHLEAQYNHRLDGTRGRAVGGASIRNYFIDTHGTVLGSHDDRSDKVYSAFGQVEYDVVPRVRAYGAVRFDTGDLFDTRVSPKAALVMSPAEGHSIRISVNRAFLAPDHSTLFTELPAAAPADLSALEAGLRASPLGPALAGVPVGELFTTSSAVPVLLLGNRHIEPEAVTAFELGYKGQLGSRAFVTADLFYERGTGFTTAALPGVNPEYGPWTAPPAVPTGADALLEQAVRDQLLQAGETVAALGLTRLPNGNTAIVLSYTNAARAESYGAELGAGVSLGGGFGLDANYTLSLFDVDRTSLIPGSGLPTRTPKHKGNFALLYAGGRFDARASFRFTGSFDWGGSLLTGRVPSSQTVDLRAGVQAGPRLRVHALVTNLLDQKRFQIYGGSVIGRQVLAGMTATF
jgi:outer membrane receptor protein involved in Fe transport